MIFHPINPTDRRVTQPWADNFIRKWKPMYWPWGHIPSWQYHLGVDFASRKNGNWDFKNLPIHAWVSGKMRVFKDPWKGNVVQITWKDYFIEYIHLSSFEWSDRDIFVWDVVWYTGNTGTYTTAAHLHMWVRKIVDWVIDKNWVDHGWFDFSKLLVDTLDISEDDVKRMYGIPLLFKWVDTEVSLTPKEWYPRVTAEYDHKLNKIIMYPLSWSMWKKKMFEILEHEFAHYIHVERMYAFHRELFDLWREVSEWSPEMLKKAWYTENAYVTRYAKSNFMEDFAETIEEYIKFPEKIYWNYADYKVKVAVDLYNRMVTKINKI